MNTMIPISVAIVTQDEEDRLPRCLESVSFADEVLVVDSGSRDNTIPIAESFGCKVISHSWQGYAKQKQFAVDHCQHEWVLILDSDERIPPETVRTIRDAWVPNSSIAGYCFYRKNFFHGRWIRHCGWWPDRVLRLVHRDRGHFSNDRVHERWIANGEISDLNASIEHYSFRNYADLIQKMQNYSTLASQSMYENGRKATLLSPIFHGLWMFFRTYCLELGLLEGFDGFMISLMNAEGSFMKYAKLRERIIISK